MTRIVGKVSRKQRQVLLRVLGKAKSEGELAPDADLGSMADYFESTLAGIRMAAKTGKSRRALRDPGRKRLRGTMNRLLLSRQNCYCFEALDRPDRLETVLFGNRGTT